MEKRYYFDTSIWLDFLENRNEPNFPKGNRVEELIRKITASDSRIVWSGAIMDELSIQRADQEKIEYSIDFLKNILIFVECTDRQWRRARDLSSRREVPLFDALHALIARDWKATIVTRDKHFEKLTDIVKYEKPEDLI